MRSIGTTTGGRGVGEMIGLDVSTLGVTSFGADTALNRLGVVRSRPETRGEATMRDSAS